MSKELSRMATKSISHSASTSGAVGKGLVVAGSAALALTFLASLIPFIGVFGLGVIMMVVGILLWE